VSAPADQIVALVAHARDVPATERQRFGAGARASQASGGGLLLETCHRVEWYAIAGAGIRTPPALPLGGRRLVGAEAVRHAIAVATGRDSVVVGEDQVLHQLRQAYESARSGSGLDSVLERLFTVALRSGRLARSWQRGAGTSLGDAAIAALERDVGALAGREVLIVGAGRMGRLAAGAAAAAGASVSVANRSPHRAAEVASATRGRVTSFDPGGDVGRSAAIVLALSAPWPIGPDTIDSLIRSTTCVVDLSVPPAVPTDLAVALGPRLTTADDLARHPHPASTTDERALARLDRLIDETAAAFLAWLDGRDRRAVAQALVERADRERETELAELWRRLPDLDPQARATIEGMSRHLAQRLLRDPLERLGADGDGRHERAVRELWTL
jgi:glutamyl-tRNA reductase